MRFFQKSYRIYTIFLFVSFEKEKSLKPALGVRTQDPPCENGHIFSAECTGLFLNFLSIIDRSAAAGTVHRRRFVRYYFLSPIVSKKSPDLHDCYVILSGAGGGPDPPWGPDPP